LVVERLKPELSADGVEIAGLVSPLDDPGRWT
jgi:hypothetical protein